MDSKDNRKFYRADFKTHGYIILKDNVKLDFELINISLKGILVELQNHPLEMEESYDLRIKLASTDIEIKTIAVLVHEKDDKLGFYFKEIDLDSMIHLRRLLELNTPNEGEIEKELAFLKNFS
jgi:hypothetical protein